MNVGRVRIKDFGPFTESDIQFSPGLNVILGDNGTGKTFLLKLLYAALAGDDVMLKLKRVFTPKNHKLTRLIRYGQPFASILLERSDGAVLQIGIPHKAKEYAVFEEEWQKSRLESVYIPSEDVLAHAPGFLSAFSHREIAFDDTYADILMKAFLPPLKNPAFVEFIANLEKAINGKVFVEGERFYLKSGKSKLEFSLVSEGVRRLALLWLLLRNGSIQPGSVLFWDLPETGLSNKFKRIVASAFAEFASAGVQVIVTTNSLFLLREFEIEVSKKHYPVRYINLQKTESGVQTEQADSLAEVGLISALEESLLQADRYMEV